MFGSVYPCYSWIHIHNINLVFIIHTKIKPGYGWFKKKWTDNPYPYYPWILRIIRILRILRIIRILRIVFAIVKFHYVLQVKMKNWNKNFSLKIKKKTIIYYLYCNDCITKHNYGKFGMNLIQKNSDFFIRRNKSVSISLFILVLQSSFRLLTYLPSFFFILFIALLFFISLTNFFSFLAFS